MKTTKIIVCGMAVLTAAVLGGCQGNKSKGQTPDIVEDTTAMADSTVYGVCGDGCTMSTLQLITDKGDTIDCILESPDGGSAVEVQGGIGVGDRVGATLQTDADGNHYALTAINITSLTGKWSSLDNTFQLHADGSVTSSMKEPKPYTHWSLVNGRLVLSADTFDITVLGHDSLCLKGGQGAVGYRRLK